MILAAVLLVAVLMPAGVALAGDAEEREVYKSATEYDYPPFSVTSSGEADGFSVDLLKAVAQEEGLPLSFKIDQWSVIKEELNAGELDVLPLVGYTEERDEYFDFSVPYIVMYGNIFVRSDNQTISTEGDLSGKEIIVMEGDNAHEFALRMSFTDKLYTVATYEEAFKLLSSGKHDAVLAQSLVGEKLINDLSIKNIRAVTQLDNDGVTRIKTRLSGFEQKFCFAVKVGDKELLAKLNEGLAIVSENGTYDELYKKWFPFLIDDTPSTEQVIIYVTMVVVPVIIVLLLAFIYFFRREVKRKTLELETAHNEKLIIEAQLRHQQKLEAVGTLAGGVAHEINNPLNGIMNYAELISDETDENDPRSVYAKEIICETERISAIVKNLLQFSRHEKQTHSYASVYDIVDQTVSLVNTIIKKDQIKLDIDIEEGLPDIKCRSQQIQQVLMNLLTNARDALNDKYPEFDENKVIRVRGSLFESSGRRWVRITVEDRGCGIPDEVWERMFEPFFSTKPKDKGTGLGLAISFGIVKDHHGKIDIETEPGEYTRFILELPVDNGWQL
jgi:signal transduction histidine kinase